MAEYTTVRINKLNHAKLLTLSREVGLNMAVLADIAVTKLLKMDPKELREIKKMRDDIIDRALDSIPVGGVIDKTASLDTVIKDKPIAKPPVVKVKEEDEEEDLSDILSDVEV